MRTEKELWEVVLSRPDLFEKGLCFWIINIDEEGLISREEYNFLDQILTDEMAIARVGYFIGRAHEIQPRIDWINERIKEL